MNKLMRELQRLYFLEDGGDSNGQGGDSSPGGKTGKGPEAEAGFRLVGSDGSVRAMVLAFERSGDWPSVAKLHRGLQEDLELPPPAISVSGRSGYLLWLSLAAPVPFGDAAAFLDALRLKYLADVSPACLCLMPDADDRPVYPLPALDEATGKWSAFIDPDMGSMFIEEAGLEMAPNMNRQAEMLGRLVSVTNADFRRALDLLRSATTTPPANEIPTELEQGGGDFSRLGENLAGRTAGEGFSDPKTFLLAVMNDASAGASHRIKAAKALLPYFHSPRCE